MGEKNTHNPTILPEVPTFSFFILIFSFVCVCVCVCVYKIYGGLPGGSIGEESTCNAGDPGLILGLGRSSILAWRIPWTGVWMEGYSSWGHRESDTT